MKGGRKSLAAEVTQHLAIGRLQGVGADTTHIVLNNKKWSRRIAHQLEYTTTLPSLCSGTFCVSPLAAKEEGRKFRRG